MFMFIFIYAKKDLHRTLSAHSDILMIIRCISIMDSIQRDGIIWKQYLLTFDHWFYVQVNESTDVFEEYLKNI